MLCNFFISTSMRSEKRSVYFSLRILTSWEVINHPQMKTGDLFKYCLFYNQTSLFVFVGRFHHKFAF